MSYPGLSKFACLLRAVAAPALGQNPEDEAPPALLEQTVPVAEAEAPAANAAPPLTEEQALREFDLFQRYLADRNYDEADVSA